MALFRLPIEQVTLFKKICNLTAKHLYEGHVTERLLIGRKLYNPFARCLGHRDYKDLVLDSQAYGNGPYTFDGLWDLISNGLSFELSLPEEPIGMGLDLTLIKLRFDGDVENPDHSCLDKDLSVIRIDGFSDNDEKFKDGEIIHQRNIAGGVCKRPLLGNSKTDFGYDHYYNIESLLDELDEASERGEPELAVIAGMNGSGKSAFGKTLAEAVQPASVYRDSSDYHSHMTGVIGVMADVPPETKLLILDDVGAISQANLNRIVSEQLANGCRVVLLTIEMQKRFFDLDCLAFILDITGLHRVGTSISKHRSIGDR